VFDRPDIPDEEQTAYMVLNDVSRMIFRRLKKGGESVGLKPGYRHILFHLAHGDDGGTQQDLVNHTKLSAPTISVSLAKMELEGIVTRKTDSEDMRIVRAYLTGKGWDLDRAMKKTIDDVEAEFSAALSAEELAEMKKMLIKVRDNFMRKGGQPLEKAD
jgi:DNA-binding MarR family transcriptional regulator